MLKPGGWICARTPNRWGLISVAARAVPNRLHVATLRRLQPGRLAEDVFPTRYAMNTQRDLGRLFPAPRWSVLTYGHPGVQQYAGSSIAAWRAAGDTRPADAFPDGAGPHGLHLEAGRVKARELRADARESAKLLVRHAMSRLNLDIRRDPYTSRLVRTLDSRNDHHGHRRGCQRRPVRGPAATRRLRRAHHLRRTAVQRLPQAGPPGIPRPAVGLRQRSDRRRRRSPDDQRLCQLLLLLPARSHHHPRRGGPGFGIRLDGTDQDAGPRGSGRRSQASIRQRRF